MSGTITSPFMSMPVPIPTVDPGPQWAYDTAACLSILDSHNHSSGQGQQIQPNGLNINTDLSFQSNNATALRTTRYVSQSVSLTGASDVGCLYVVGNELYYNDVTGGHQIPITLNGSVTGSSGTITGLPSGTAGAAYSAGTFVFTSATSTGANMDIASLILRNSTASSKGLTLQPPSAMGANYSLTLPALPASQKIMTLDSSGNITAPYTVDGSTITISSNVIGVPNGGINSVQIGTNAILNSNMAVATLLTGSIASNTLLPSNSAGIPVSVTSSSGSFSGSGTPTAVTNLSTTYTLSNTSKYVEIKLISDGSGNTSFIRGTGGVLFIQANGVTVAQFNVGTPSGATINLPPSSAAHVYTPASASSVTYSVLSTNVDVFFTKLTVREV